MNNDDYSEVEANLIGKSYQDLDVELDGWDSNELLRLLDSKSRRVGDTAASVLDRRNEMDFLIDALVADRIRTSLGRIRATNTLNWRGRELPQATEACEHCLDDRSDGVLSNALFGIVFMRRRDLLPKLQEKLMSAAPGSKRHQLLQNAVHALEEDNPSIYSPGFRDAWNVWKLDEPAPQPSS